VCDSSCALCEDKVEGRKLCRSVAEKVKRLLVMVDPVKRLSADETYICQCYRISVYNFSSSLGTNHLNNNFNNIFSKSSI
jgi:hypothetical protein